MAGPITLRLPDDESGEVPNPGTLKAPPVVDKDYVRQKELEYKRVLREYADRNPDVQYLPKEGTIVKRYNKPERDGGAMSEFGFAFGGDEGGMLTELAEPEVRRAYEDWIDAQDELKYLSASQGSAKSWYDTEQDKTQEIERQYDDFKDRATTYSRLLGDEQDYGMRADDANVAAEAAVRKYGFTDAPLYTHMPMSSSLSSILRPSLPDYVRPDYRLNAAVGLPGPEGFDDPDYDANGMPRYAAGTDGADGFLGLVQQQLGHIPYALLPKKPWPWMGGR